MNDLKFRNELKFFISKAGYRMLKTKLEGALALDKNANEETSSYFIRSLYFDDAFSSAFYEKIDGVEKREKFRIRFYDFDDSFIRLEKKIKYGSLTSKRSCAITREMCDRILNGDYSFLLESDDMLLKEFYAKIKTEYLKPSVIVDYTREAFTFPVENVRITFDYNLRSAVYNHNMFTPLTPALPVISADTIILEVKFDKLLPSHISSLIETIPVSRNAISKFALCRKYH